MSDNYHVAWGFQGTVIQDCNPRTCEAETVGLQVRSHTGLHSYFETSLGYIRGGGACLKTNTIKIKQNKKQENQISINQPKKKKKP